MTEVELPDGTVLEFPASMSQEEILAVMQKQFPPSQPGQEPPRPEGMPPEMVFDPQTGGYVDTALAAQRMGKAQGASASFLAGAPFVGEWIDEGMGAVDQALTGANPEIAAETFRQSRQQFSESNPKTATALQLGGGIVGSLPAAAIAGPAVGALRGAPMAGKVAAGVGSGLGFGALEGAVQGAGANDENRSSGALSGGLTGGALGAVLGGAAPFAFSGMKRVANAVLDRLSSQNRRVPGMSVPASRMLMEAAQADDIANMGRQNLAAGGSLRMPADLGPATQNLLDVATNTSGAVATVRPRVAERAAASNKVLTDAFDRVLGGPTAIRRLVQANSDAARPGLKAAYKEAYDTAIDYTSPGGRRILELFDEVNADPKFRAALQEANRLIRREDLPRQYLIDLAEDGTFRSAEMPNTVQLDYVKRGLQKIVNDGIDPVTGKYSSDARTAQSLARDIRRALGDANPAYDKAVNMAADSLSLENALTFGRKALGASVDRADVEDWVRNATDIEKQNFAQGVRSYIDNVMANTQAAITNSDIDAAEVRKIYRTLSSKAAREKLDVVLGREATNEIYKALEEAQRSFALKASTAANSRTAGRQTANDILSEAMDYAPGQIAREAVSSPLGAYRKVTEAALGNSPIDKASRREGVLGEVADFLTGTQGPQADAQIMLLERAMGNVPIQEGRANAVAAGGTGIPGLLAYLQATQSQRERAN